MSTSPDDYSEEYTDWCAEMVCQREEIARLRRAVDAVRALIAESQGVAGLHLNGDVATWDELLRGGRFEEWLGPLSDAIEV